MIAWLLELRLSPEQSLGVVLLVAFIVGSVWEIREMWRGSAASITQAEPRTVIDFPPQRGAWTRDLQEPAEAPDPLYDTGLVASINRCGPEGQIWWYSQRTRDAMLRALLYPRDEFLLRRVHSYARMAGSTAFALHPELREPTQPPVRLPVTPPRYPTQLRALNGQRVH